MSDAHIKQAIDLAALPVDFFETNIGEFSALSRHPLGLRAATTRAVGGVA